jgi:thioesterase domain-containing protein
LLTASELRSLASQYVDGLRAVQPQGPYFLGGMCAGCRVAEQMILQLESIGQEVGLFAVLDTWVIENVNRPWLWHLHYYRQRLRSLRKMSLTEKMALLRRTNQNRIDRWTGTTQPSTVWKEAMWPENFTPPRFRAPIALFRRRKQPFYYVDDPEMGWGRRTESGVQIHEIPIDGLQHLEVLRDPCVQMISQELAGCLHGAMELNEILTAS